MTGQSWPPACTGSINGLHCRTCSGKGESCCLCGAKPTPKDEREPRWNAGAMGREPEDDALVWRDDAVTGAQFYAASPAEAARAAAILNDMERDVERAHEARALGVELARALRLAGTTEFEKEKRAALEKWEAYVLRCAGRPSRQPA